MNFENEYPRLFQFFGGYFPDADLDGITDKQVVKNYVIDCSKSENSKIELQESKSELIVLMSNIEHYWQEVGKDANRYFANSAEALEWLNMIKMQWNG